MSALLFSITALALACFAAYKAERVHRAAREYERLVTERLARRDALANDQRGSSK